MIRANDLEVLIVNLFVATNFAMLRSSQFNLSSSDEMDVASATIQVSSGNNLGVPSVQLLISFM